MNRGPVFAVIEGLTGKQRVTTMFAGQAFGVVAQRQCVVNRARYRPGGRTQWRKVAVMRPARVGTGRNHPPGSKESPC